MSINQEWEMVKNFHETFNHPTSNSPVLIAPVRAQKRYNWMLEEIDEFLEAKDICEQADAMIDLIYFALGTMVEMGLQPEELFRIVHKANMDKIWPDGQPHYNDEGKTIKPQTWEDPYPKLQAVIQQCE